MPNGGAWNMDAIDGYALEVAKLRDALRLLRTRIKTIQNIKVDSTRTPVHACDLEQWVAVIDEALGDE